MRRGCCWPKRKSRSNCNEGTYNRTLYSDENNRRQNHKHGHYNKHCLYCHHPVPLSLSRSPRPPTIAIIIMCVSEKWQYKPKQQHKWKKRLEGRNVVESAANHFVLSTLWPSEKKKRDAFSPSKPFDGYTNERPCILSIPYRRHLACIRATMRTMCLAAIVPNCQICMGNKNDKTKSNAEENLLILKQTHINSKWL